MSNVIKEVGLTLNKLDFIHRGLLTLYHNELFVSENDLMVAWINQGELIIAEKVDLTDVEPYIGAFIYLYLKINLETLQRSKLQHG